MRKALEITGALAVLVLDAAMTVFFLVQAVASALEAPPDYLGVVLNCFVVGIFATVFVGLVVSTLLSRPPHACSCGTGDDENRP